MCVVLWSWDEGRKQCNSLGTTDLHTHSESNFQKTMPSSPLPRMMNNIGILFQFFFPHNSDPFLTSQHGGLVATTLDDGNLIRHLFLKIHCWFLCNSFQRTAWLLDLSFGAFYEITPPAFELPSPVCRSTPWTSSQADLLAFLEMGLGSSHFQSFTLPAHALPSAVPASPQRAPSLSIQGKDFLPGISWISQMSQESSCTAFLNVSCDIIKAFFLADPTNSIDR